MKVFLGHSRQIRIFLLSRKLQTISLSFLPPAVMHTHTHTGSQRGGGGGRRAFHAGDDGAVQSAAEGAAATQSHSNRLPSVLWQGGADSWAGTVRHGSVQKFHRGKHSKKKKNAHSLAVFKIEQALHVQF